MGAIKLRKWDSAEHLKTDEEVVLYLEACMEEAGDDAAFIAKVQGITARAKGMILLAMAPENAPADSRCRRVGSCRIL